MHIVIAPGLDASQANLIGMYIQRHEVFGHCNPTLGPLSRWGRSEGEWEMQMHFGAMPRTSDQVFTDMFSDRRASTLKALQDFDFRIPGTDQIWKLIDHTTLVWTSSGDLNVHFGVRIEPKEAQ